MLIGVFGKRTPPLVEGLVEDAQGSGDHQQSGCPIRKRKEVDHEGSSITAFRPLSLVLAVRVREILVHGRRGEKRGKVLSS
jgi:hypothetical protein